MQAYITLDVDPDFRNESKEWENARRGIEGCLELFREYSLEERVTWFVNNAELEFTSRREGYLSRMGSGEIGLHVHLNKTPWSSHGYLPRSRERVFRAMEEEKGKLEKWTMENLGREIKSFRSGDLLTSGGLFKALEMLGIRVDSSIPSQFDWSPREIARIVLSRMPLRVRAEFTRRFPRRHAYPTLPLGASPFYINTLLEMPVHIYMGGRNLNLEWIRSRTEKHLNKGVEDLVVYWHPHEILGREEIYTGYLDYLSQKGAKFRRIGEKVGSR